MKQPHAAILASWIIAAASPSAQTVATGTTHASQTGPSVQNGGPTVPGTATLQGHVFAADSGRPLRQAQVRLLAPDIRENRLATTDMQGRYEFKEVLAGRYTISASKGSYVGLSYGQKGPQDAVNPLAILDKQIVEKVDFSLPRGGVISGRIVDEFGEPMSDVRVSAQQMQFVHDQRRMVPAGRWASTDDMGEYRLFGIAPGQYYLTATWRAADPSNREDATAYAPTYFPGTDNASQAKRLTLAAGQERLDVTMALRPIRATRVSGTATTSDGKAMSGWIFAIPTAGFGFDVAASAIVQPDGAFSINGLAPGGYALRAQTFDIAGTDGETAVVTITATGDELTDLRLVGVKPSIAKGRVLVDPTAASALPSSLTLRLVPTEPGILSSGNNSARLRDDGTFELKSGPGTMRIGLVNAADWTARAVRWNGTDVTDSGIEFKSGEDLNGLEVEVTNKRTTIAGMVTNARGETVTQYLALAFTQDREKWKTTGRYQGSGRPDQDGRFEITGLPPGEYYAVALDKMDPGQASDSEFLDAIRMKATRVSIQEGETRTVDLKIAASP